MKKQLLKSALIAVAGAGLFIGATGVTYATGYNPCPAGSAACTLSDSESYISTQNPNGLLFNGRGDTVTSTFSITPPFEPGNDTLKSVTFWVEIYDYNNSEDWWGNEYDGSEKIKYNVGVWDTTTDDIDDISGSDYSKTFSAGTLFADLGLDGLLTVKIDWNAGDFYLQSAGIDALVCNFPTPTSVPEPTTMLLFGAGAIGLAGIARGKKK